MCSHNTQEAAGRGRRLPGRGACAPADAHGTGGRARHRQMRTASAGALCTGGCARHPGDRRTHTAPADAHGTGGSARHRRTCAARAPAGTGARARRERKGQSKSESESERHRQEGGTHCHSDTILWRQVLMQVGGHWQGVDRVEDGNFKLLHEGRRTCRSVGGENDLK